MFCENCAERTRDAARLALKSFWKIANRSADKIGLRVDSPVNRTQKRKHTQLQPLTLQFQDFVENEGLG